VASFRGAIGISSANDILVGTNGFGTNFVARVNIIHTASWTPPHQTLEASWFRTKR